MSTRTPRKCFLEQRAKAARRGIYAGQYVMGRYGDEGPYSPGNVYICLCSQNVLDYHHIARPKRIAATSGDIA